MDVNINPYMSTQKMTEKNDNKAKKSTESSTNIILKSFILALTIILIVCLTILICRKVFRSEVENLGSMLEESRKDEAILNGKVKSLEQEKQLYVRKINELNNELQIKSNPYNSTLPMTEDSYDAPDPDQPKEKSKILKDKEAIKAYVNSKRTTVQDEIDDQKAIDDEAENEMINSTEREIQEQTHQNDIDEESKVDEIMEIIQSQ